MRFTYLIAVLFLVICPMAIDNAVEGYTGVLYEALVGQLKPKGVYAVKKAYNMYRLQHDDEVRRALMEKAKQEQSTSGFI